MNKSSLWLTDREYKVMSVLWDSKKDLTINEISEISGDPKLTVACIAQVIPRLLKKNLVHVEKFIPVNTKYARTFLADITRQDYLESELSRLTQKTNAASLLSALVHVSSPKKNDELMQELETFMQEYKRNRKG